MSSPVFDRTTRAMLCCGFSAFALLYCVQPLMPEMARQFGVTPAQSSWPLSVTTVTMALSLLASGALSDRIGRKALMVGALAAAAVLALCCALAQNFAQLLTLRALLGIALGGVPAVAMAYLNEEIAPAKLGSAMGVYIAGTALGGTAGRVLAAIVTDLSSWRWALGLMGAMGLYAAWDFARNLPQQRSFVAASPGWGAVASGAAAHLQDSGMRALYLLALLVMGVFVSLYNYVSFRLLGGPFGIICAMWMHKRTIGKRNH